MTEEIAYPLTPEAKEAARKLVEDWNKNKIEQLIVCRGDVDLVAVFRPDSPIREDAWMNYYPNAGILLELSRYGLISVTVDNHPDGKRTISILLLQELRNAVENEFRVSEYFQTMGVAGGIAAGRDVNISGGSVAGRDITNQE